MKALESWPPTRIRRPAWLAMRERVAGRWPQEAAYTVLRSLGIIEPYVRVSDVAHELGVTVHEVKQPGWSGAVTSKGGDAAIWVNVEEPLVRRRFTIAHELGHLLLHPIGTQYRDVEFAGDKQETEANQFAAGLLVPLWMLEREAAREDTNTARLASRFAVSEHVMSIRLSQLAGIPVEWE